VGTLISSFCTKGCGQIMLPPKDKCVNCSKTTEPFKILDSGTILTFTILYAPPEGFEPPLVLGLIELDLDQNDNTDRKLLPPKLICEGRPKNIELSIGLKVKVEQKHEKYYFTMKK
jgi:uncharacterized OB-fold protein